MGASVSTILLGFHTALEVVAGSAVFATGKIPGSSKPVSGEDRLWKRWHASGLFAMAYVGYAGLTDASLTGHAIKTCCLFHAAATGAMVFAVKDGTQSMKEFTVTNIHLYCVLGFAAVGLGLVQ